MIEWPELRLPPINLWTLPWWMEDQSIKGTSARKEGHKKDYDSFLTALRIRERN